MAYKDKEKLKAYQKAWRARPEYRAQRKDYYRANREAYRDKWLRRTWGISLAEFTALLDGQDGRCAICGTKNPGKKGFAIDHDHSTGRIRGVLCRGCNTGIGLLGESVDTMISAIEYIKRHKG